MARHNVPSGASALDGLNRQLLDGTLHLTFQGPQGYLRSLLKALGVPIESQLLVFSKTSGQASRISPENPRALYFSDSVVVGWVPGGFIEIAGADSGGSLVFCTLEQALTQRPVLGQHTSCLGCHAMYANGRVAQMVVRSVFPASDGTPIPLLGQTFSDHRSRFEKRWGGWYVTGRRAALPHMGNAATGNDGVMYSLMSTGLPNHNSLLGQLDTSRYLSPYSDIVALLIFDHQMQLSNLIYQLEWQARHPAGGQGRPAVPVGLDPALSRSQEFVASVNALVDYLLLVDEQPLIQPVIGSSGFTETFSSLGPCDRMGRSLRQFDLKKRLLRYPCSYMVYSSIFDALPRQVKEAVYYRMWQVLSGKLRGGVYDRLSIGDRSAVIDILRDTKTDLPGYFVPITH